MIGSERRVQILSRAAEICARRGFSGTTLDDIAREAGVSRALVVQHFGGKENLYRELIDFLFSGRQLAAGPEVKACMDAGDDAGAFMAFFHDVLDLMTAKPDSSPLRLILFSMLEYTDLYRHHYKKRFVRNSKIFADYLAARMAAGALRTVDPQPIAMAFIATMVQLIFQHITFPDLFPREEVVAAMRTNVELVIAGLECRPAAGLGN